MEWSQVLYGLAGAFAYYVLRYNRKESFTFIEYLRLEWPAFLKGFVSFFVVWGGWSAFNQYEFLPFTLPTLPEMTAPLALFIGFAGKKIGEYTLGKLKQFGGSNG